MEVLTRVLEKRLLKILTPNKVILLLGARRTGKTILLKKVIQSLKEPHLLLNGEDMSVQEILARRTLANYQKLLGKTRILIIDEAQKIPEIGQILKLMVDEIEGLKILVTGSSAFSISQETGEPLTGRKRTLHLYPITESEYDQIETPFQKQDQLRERLVFGNYPELLHLENRKDKEEYLNEIVNSFLLKDVLAMESIRSPQKLINLLRLIAFQVGNEVSYDELGKQLSMSKNTVEKYLDLLSKVYVLHRIGGFSRNLRKEVTKSSKWYFWDMGLRNVIIANMNPVTLRNDIGQLWENYAINERLKHQKYNRITVNNYFWRTYDQQEIDLVEERDGKLFGYEFKWNPRKKAKAPGAWSRNYSKAEFKVINPSNFFDWLEK